MENSILVASGARHNIQKALDKLLPIVGNEGVSRPMVENPVTYRRLSYE